MDGLDRWIERQYRHAAAAMLPSLSAVGIVKHRPGFGQTVTPRRGSIVASPVLAAYDPDPDYFFHWFRDSAVVIDALRLLAADGSLSRAAALEYFRDFLAFSLSLRALDGRALVAAPAWRAGVQADFEKFVRSDAELATVHGERVAAEARVNPDATLDISKWARPQHDGPPLRLIAVLRWLREMPLERETSERAAELIRSDIAFARARWRIPSFDIWEEEKGHHYYTLRVAATALEEGAAWLETNGMAQEAQPCREDARAIVQRLDGYWLEDAGYYRSRMLDSGERSTKELDIAVIFSAIHASGTGEGAHTVHDPRMQATLRRLDALFDGAYAINKSRPAGRGPAMGRYAGDVYYSGGAYYFSTLAAAELCYRAAAGSRVGRDESRTLTDRGDAYLETVRAFTPPSGDLSEQFDQKTGEQTSARHLAWSYAAFISCVVARRDAYRSQESVAPGA
ncbi:MAG TPA: glycoside hydrolase family 15 protein [Steroidobacteraceae bacterium]|nr:glycoside hydrolase family 15 protein [Steroidobacteraceae bacterium]